MKYTPAILFIAVSLVLFTSCGEGSICSCRFAGLPRDTVYTMGRNISLSDLQGKCKAVQSQNPVYDTCRAQELKD